MFRLVTSTGSVTFPELADFMVAELAEATVFEPQIFLVQGLREYFLSQSLIACMVV